MNETKTTPTRISELTAQSTDACRVYALSDNTLEAEFTTPAVMALSTESTTTSYSATVYSWSGSTLTATTESVVAGNIGVSGCRLYAALTLPTLPRNPRIKRALLTVDHSTTISSTNTTHHLGLYTVSETLTDGATAAPATVALLDYEPLSADSDTYSFDVTKLMDSGGSANVCLRLMSESAASNNYATLSNLRLVVAYEQSYAVNTSARTLTHDLGFFGQGSVDLAAGNLMIESEDFAWGGARMPVTVKHQYTSALGGYQYTANGSIGLNVADFSAMKLGTGWRLNLMQSMVGALFILDGVSMVGYAYTDENGEEIRFKQSDKLDATGAYNLYEDIDSGELLYDPQTHTLTQGEETYLFESGRLVRITDANGNTVSITYTDGRLTAVTDGAGRVFTLTYDTDGYLTTITAPDGSCMSYSYNGEGLLTKTYPDGKYACVGVSNIFLYNAGEKDGQYSYGAEYGYSNQQLRYISTRGRYTAAYPIITATEISYSAASRRTIVTTTEPLDEDETAENIVKTVYSFDADGNVLSKYAYTDTAGEILPYSAEGEMATTIHNLLHHHDFSDNDGGPVWIKNNTDFYGCVQKYEPYALYGSCMYCMASTDEPRLERGIYQETVALSAGDYMASAWMLTRSALKEADTAGAYIRVTDAAGNILAETEHIANTYKEYTRLIAPFTIAEEQAVTVHLLMDGRGAAYFDSAQLEPGDCANDYNLIKNDSFEQSYWWRLGTGAEYSANERFSLAQSLKITGDLDAVSSAYQSVEVRKVASTRETFMLSGWAKANALSDREREGAEPPVFRLCATINYADGGEADVFYADFSPATEEWQRASVEIAKTRFAEISSMTVSCDYGYNAGAAYFDDIQLIRTSLELELTADDFSSSVSTDEATETTDEETTVDEPETFEEFIDRFGNTLTETAFTDGEFGTVYRSFAYDETGNDLVSETDARGNVTRYTVDPVTSRNTEVTDRCGNKTLYVYDSKGRTTSMTNADVDGTELAGVSYVYDSFDNLTEIARGDGMKYALGYNPYHHLESIGISGKDTPLTTYSYKKGTDRLKQITYANGHTMKLTYNSAGQAVTEKWYDEESVLIADYRYAYDNRGNLVRSVDIPACKEYTYIYEDGVIVRATESALTLNEAKAVVGKSLLYSVWYAYNANDELIRKRLVNADGTVERVIYYENPEDGSPVIRQEINGKTVLSHSKTDAFGRKEFDELQIGTGFVSRKFEYAAGEVTDEHVEHEKLKSSPTTQLVERIVLSDGRTLSYEYDAEERITKVIDSVEGVTIYTYDALGQLEHEIRDNAVITCMTYDNYGNIRTKNGKAYVYDETWKDLLISYDGQSITYDAQGNPTNYLGHVLSWEKGRQLKSYDGNTYTYNANGIRTSKTVGGIKHEYILDGANILKETWGENSLLPVYSNEDEVCGIIYNGTPYYFLKNLQGDIIEIINANAEVVARYSYDAWGKCTITQDDETGIAAINPFRYRGYYYDAEIGLYYLQSRYYDPEIGRFLNADDATFATVSGNLFAYCENDVVNNKDIDGFWSWPATAKMPSWVLSAAIDAIILWLAGALNATWIGITAPLKALAKKAALKVFQKAVAPAVKGIIGKIVAVAIKALIWLGKKALAISINVAITQTLGILLSNGARFISACLSLGGFIAAIVDVCTDKKFDGWIKLW